MQFFDLLSDVEILELSGDKTKQITGIAYDSRNVGPGDVFVCVKGYASDGHKYAADAEAAGAAAIVAQDAVDTKLPVAYVADTRLALAQISNTFYGRPTERLKLVGVTGTNGKTTVTYLLKTILEHAGKKVGLIGTNQNMIGERILPSKHTTPEAPELYAMLDDMLREGAEYVVMEVSSHALALGRVEGCRFETAVFTNLTQDHLDFHADMEDYYAAKKQLFSMAKRAVINTDDEYGKRLAGEIPCQAMTYAIEHKADLQASDIKISARGVTFTLKTAKESMPMRLGIPGRFSVYNALAATGAGLSLGFDADDITKGLIIAKGVKGRAEVVNTGRDYTVIIDYAHTPDGLANIIPTVREFTQGRVITLFGCGGDRDRTKRPLMGEMAGRLSDFCIVTTDNPRSEPPMAIIADIVKGIEPTGCEYVVIENRQDAIRYALTYAQPDDVVILAGKGHETYQILADKTIDFDERKIVAQILDDMQQEK